MAYHRHRFIVISIFIYIFFIDLTQSQYLSENGDQGVDVLLRCAIGRSWFAATLVFKGRGKELTFSTDEYMTMNLHQYTGYMPDMRIYSNN